MVNSKIQKMKKEESARTKTQQILSKSWKINPEGTCGPIWPVVIPLVLSPSWLYCGVKEIVDITGTIDCNHNCSELH